LSIVSLVTLPLLYTVVTRRNPFKFVKGLSRALLQGIATSSSAACLPVTFECVHDMNLDPRVAKFVLTVGTILATIGTALFQAVSPIFIAQINGITLDMGQYITLCVTACLASAGAATVPSSALVTMIIVLSALGLPIDDLSLIFTVDWLLRHDLNNPDTLARSISTASTEIQITSPGIASPPEPQRTDKLKENDK
ncbi:Amino acid transporter, partial [Trichostrongylus colubriformis]